MNQTDKSSKVEGILQALNDDLSGDTLSNVQRQATLEQLKAYGRDPVGADAIYCSPGITTLTKFAFGDYPPDVVHEALKVIANALLLQPKLQDDFIELDGLAHVAKLYQLLDHDSEFLGARILFLCTYAAKADYSGAFSANLINSIEQHVARHADSSTEPTPVRTMAGIETTKLMFNLNNKYSEECQAFNAIVPELCRMLLSCRESRPALEPPVGPILNILACLDFGAVPAQSNSQKVMNDLRALSNKLVNILNDTLKQYKPTQLDTVALSLITVLRMLYETSSTDVQTDLKRKLLPADSERDLPLGKSSSLASQLLRLTTSPGLANLPEGIASLMFEMSDKDATKFVKNIGYGYAAGYLATHQIPVPDTIKDPATIGSSTDNIPVNPVTGQRIDKEAVPDIPDMTEEEKEREAERLFVLFERLRATGVVNAENPVRKAMEEGRLEELSDSE